MTRTGRPTNDPKNHRESFRLSDSDIAKLDYILANSTMTKTEVIRAGIDEIYKKIKTHTEI